MQDAPALLCHNAPCACRRLAHEEEGSMLGVHQWQQQELLAQQVCALQAWQGTCRGGIGGRMDR